MSRPAPAPAVQPTEVVVVVPGLLDTELTAGALGDVETRALERLLASAETSPAPLGGIARTLFSLFGVTPGAADALPVAAVARRGEADGDNAIEGWWLRADPVSLQPGSAGVRLVHPALVRLTREDADGFAAALAPVLAQAGLRLEMPHPQRWYIRAEHDQTLRTHALADVVGQDITGALPSGGDAGAWTALLTEMEMVLHACPINEARERTGRPPINSVWLWGGGRAPHRLTARWRQVRSNEPLARGLGALAGSVTGALPDDVAALTEPGAHLVVLEPLPPACAGEARCADAVAELNARWAAPLGDALRRRAIAAVVLIDPERGALRVDARRLGRTWWPLPAWRRRRAARAAP